jgi:hypothetical protein
MSKQLKLTYLIILTLIANNISVNGYRDIMYDVKNKS